MNAFIIRPFGQKKGIDFDRVEADLIRPALIELNVPGATTGQLTYAGNIRLDMFEQLVLADLVVADISIHNANVFYELGLRHGLRNKRTFLIRCKEDEVPFDLKTDRYLEYEKEHPGTALANLIEGLRATIHSTGADSPAFLLLPKLRPSDPEELMTVPEEFELEVRRAQESEDVGCLMLLARETEGLPWALAGLRAPGRVLYELGAHRQAKLVWEAVLRLSEDDIEAHLLLGTIHERLKDFAASDHVLEHALKGQALRPDERAEGYALLGRNAKRRWQWTWEKAPNPAQAALKSDWLVKAQQYYTMGFFEDQNHFFSGLGALALLTVQLELAEMLPTIWEAQFDSSEEAKAQTESLRKERVKLAGAVEYCLEATSRRLARLRKEDIWLDLSKADLKCLTSKNAARVGAAYRSIADRAEQFASRAARDQLLMYQQLGILRTNVQAALDALPTSTVADILYVILFTGHQIDEPDRKKPRFPAACESAVRARIKEEIAAAIAGNQDRCLGIAGAASGGDILFHEVCAESGVPTHIYLALPPNEFINESVAPAGGNWEDRFRALLQAKKADEVRQLAATDEMPKWLRVTKQDYGIWQRNNLWILHNALALGAEHTTLVALWDGESGDGPGGTKDMIEQARKLGARTLILHTQEACGM